MLFEHLGIVLFYLWDAVVESDDLRCRFPRGDLDQVVHEKSTL